MKELIKKLNLQTKAALLTGYKQWWTHGNENPYIPVVSMSDGPHGLRKQEENSKNINDSIRATCFPTACATASSWDIETAYAIGDAIGKEALAQKVSTVLGPGVNIKRTPLCGRNFEYFSEDPYLSGRIGAAWIKGVQGNKVGTSLKHFAVNSQETRRMTVDTLVDMRALREIYLSSFEYAVKEAKPATVMLAYNKINGKSCTENKWLITDLLRGEFGFEGLAVSDWGATYNIVEALKAGMDLEMPDSLGYSAEKIVTAVNNGDLAQEDVDRALLNVLKFSFERRRHIKEDYKVDYAKNHIIAKDCAAESAVLLKNEKSILPFDAKQKVLVVGEMAEKMRFQGAGSSHINTAHTPNLLEAMSLGGANFEYAKGYNVTSDKINEALEKEAVEKAKDYGVILFCGGLPDIYESEGYDRTHLELPDCQKSLIEEFIKNGKKVVFLAFGGSPFTLPFYEGISAMLNMNLAGQAVGEAAYELLYGIKNPCGKLAESWPLSLEDTPCHNYFNKKINSSEHRESIFVGYRYYDTFNKQVRFPFGYGLSYTSFEYSDFSVKKNNTYNYSLTVKVKNTGSRAGKEVVQLYIKNPEQNFLRAKRELKGFIKTDLLQPNEEQEITFQLDKKSFAFYDVNTRDWQVPKGEYEAQISGSLNDVKFFKALSVEGVSPPDVKESLPAYFDRSKPNLTIPDEQFVLLLERPLVEERFFRKGEFTMRNTLYDMRKIKLISLITKIALKQMAKITGLDKNDPALLMSAKGSLEMPLECITAMSEGAVARKFCLALVYIANGRFFKGLKTALSKDKTPPQRLIIDGKN